MKNINRILCLLGILGYLLSTISISNNSGPTTEFILFCSVSSTLFLAGFLGEQICKK